MFSTEARGTSPLRIHAPAVWLLAATVLATVGTAPALCDEPLQYNRDIRPILADNCFACHGADSAARQADLRLDQREAAIEAGAITPGKADESALIDRVLSRDADLVMPPAETKKSLTAAQKDLLKRWIAAGAEYELHWSFIPPQKVDPPPVKNSEWVKNDIDRFVLAKLESHGLSPAPAADGRTLFRRLHLDITGLPPAPRDIAAFATEYGSGNDAVLSAWIDKLMQSPAWGEHRARYWLDAARYGDTHGLHFDNYREMWPYRDWVIRAFNANQPFDAFTIEQIAGDLLPDPTLDQLVATGFQRCNITTNEGGTIDEENLANYAADRVQTFGWVYLGLTTNCAQCHDHKFDPFTMRDYYSLAAFFRNTTQGPKDGNVKDGRGPVTVVPTKADRPRWDALPVEIAAAKASRDARKQAARPEFEKWLAAATPETLDRNLPSDGLALHVPLDEGSGNEIRSGDATGATFQASGELSWIKEGKFGPAPVINTNSTFDLGDLGGFEIGQSFSYGAWVRAGRENISGAILARMNGPEGYRGWDLWQQGRNVAVHIIDSWPDNALKVTTQNAVLKPNQWQHVFATYDGSGKPGGIKIFVDGEEQPLRVEVNSLKPDGAILAATSLRIGQRSHGQVFEGGAIQDVRIYTRSLSAPEIRTISQIAHLRALLAAAADQRTPQQTDALYEYYLATHDGEYPALAKAVANLDAELAAIRDRSPVTHIQTEKPNSPAMAHILMRGEYDRPTEQVPAATPAALPPMPEGTPSNRLGLARWLVDPSNPLTARVTVNRFWQQVFGLGIVATAEDFGVMGTLPSHPELLDRLAIDFRESSWNVKQFFKTIFMSAAYRQAAVVTAEKLERDRHNVLLSRGPRFRMDAEMIRDAALASSGLLSSKMYGPGVKPYQPEAIWDVVGLPGGNTRNYVQDHGEDLYRRTIYSFWKRMAPPPNLDAFNAPSREVCIVRRERTNTPLQALVTLNDPQFVEAARHLAQQALVNGDKDDQVNDFISLRVLGRPLDDDERSILNADREEFLAYYQSHPESAAALIAVGESKADTAVDAPVLAAWTMVCNQVMNLDEALNK